MSNAIMEAEVFQYLLLVANLPRLCLLDSWLWRGRYTADASRQRSREHWPSLPPDQGSIGEGFGESGSFALAGESLSNSRRWQASRSTFQSQVRSGLTSNMTASDCSQERILTLSNIHIIFIIELEPNWSLAFNCKQIVRRQVQTIQGISLWQDLMSSDVLFYRHAVTASNQGPPNAQARALTQLGVVLHTFSSSAFAHPDLKSQQTLEAQVKLKEALELDSGSISANFNLARIQVSTYMPSPVPTCSDIAILSMVLIEYLDETALGSIAK